MKMRRRDRRGEHIILFTFIVRRGSIDVAIQSNSGEQSYISLVGLAHHIRRDSI